MTSLPFASPRLERPREAPLRGVCAALARSTGTDPVLWRVLAVVLTVFGGLGVALYLVAMATIPREGEPQALADRLLHGPDRSLRVGEWVLLVLLALSVLVLGADVDGLIALAVLGGLGLLWWRRRLPQAGEVPVGADPDARPGSGAVRITDDPTHTWQVPVVAAPPRPRRARSPLTGLTVSLAAVVAGVLVLVGAQGEVSVPAEVVLAAVLAVVGAGLVGGAWWGRSGGLIALAVVLGLALAVTSGTRPVLDAGVGDRLWTPAGPASYRLGAGHATLDLHGLPVREGAWWRSTPASASDRCWCSSPTACGWPSMRGPPSARSSWTATPSAARERCGRWTCSSGHRAPRRSACR